MNGPTVSDVATLRAVIAHSQIYVPQIYVLSTPAQGARLLPPGFDAADLAILEWIAAEGRRAARRVAVM
jgi:hypothetical protein